MSKAFFMDYETMRNLTVAVFINYKDPLDKRVFVIHELRNDFVELMDFLESCAHNNEYHISFNGLSFDGQISQALLNNRKALSEMTPEIITGKIYKKAQALINEQDYSGRVNGVPEWRLSIPQIDLFKLNHWDFPGRRASLKWLQYTNDWPNVQEMPIHHSKLIGSLEEIQTVIDYCTNDVEFTGVLYEKSKSLLQVRKDIKSKYNINCLSYSNTKMGSEVLLKMYCKRTGKKKWDVKQLKTYRSKVDVSEILFEYVKFRSPEFNILLESFKKLVITGTKGEFKESVVFKGIKYDYGMGGIHACTRPGIYKSDEEYVVMDLDVASLYPSIAVVNKMYPAHLGPEFYQVYKEDIVDVRLAEKAKGKLGNKGIVDGFKEAANASYGNSNNKHSWLNDMQYTMQTTINGQLLISMLVEAITLDLADSQVLQVNTDGATIRLLRSDLEQYYRVCNKWQELTQLKLEYAEVDTMWIFDVNNYFLKYTDPSKEMKFKGRFQFKDLEMHKNKSFLVVNKAIYEFFVNGVFPEEYLKTNRNIYDWCGGARVTAEWDFMGTCVEDGLVSYEPLQKVVRYYISNKGCKIIKVHREDGRKINLVAGRWYQTEMNNFVDIPWEDYDICEGFYLEMIKKEINILQEVKSQQLSLF